MEGLFSENSHRVFVSHPAQAREMEGSSAAGYLPETGRCATGGNAREMEGSRTCATSGISKSHPAQAREMQGPLTAKRPRCPL